MSEYVKIKHREYGTVEGVKHREYTSGWEKFENGRLSCFDPEHGWALVPEEEWVTLEVNKEDWQRLNTVYFNQDMYFKMFGVRWRYPSPKKGQMPANEAVKKGQ